MSRLNGTSQAAGRDSFPSPPLILTRYTFCDKAISNSVFQYLFRRIGRDLHRSGLFSCARTFFHTPTANNGRLKEDTVMKVNLTAVKGFFGPQVTSDGRFNPAYLAVASRCYRIQVHSLHIPDQFGFFWPGSPRLQVYEGAAFVALGFGLAFLTVYEGFVVLWIKLAMRRPVSALAGAMLVMNLVLVASCWILACLDRRRAPDYDWGDNWTLRKE